MPSRRSFPADERLVTIEDSAELQLRRKHVVRLETRIPTSEGAGAVTARDLVRNALRMRPDRIILGEVRSGEALDMLQAMNTGHEGSLTTIHANDARDALSRLEVMVAMAGFDLPVDVVRRYIASAINVIVHLARLKGGVRRVMRIVGNRRSGEQRISAPRVVPLPAGRAGRPGAGDGPLPRVGQRAGLLRAAPRARHRPGCRGVPRAELERERRSREQGATPAANVGGPSVIRTFRSC